MENNKDAPSQVRFLLAFLLSMVVLFGWPYIFPHEEPSPSAEKKAPASTPITTSPVEKGEPAAGQSVGEAVKTETPGEENIVSDNPSRFITIKTDLYQVTLDSKGAVAKSWILLRDKSPKRDRPLFGDASVKREKNKPLELISEEARKRFELPFRVRTKDETVNRIANNSNYSINLSQDVLTLKPGEEKDIVFSLTGPNGLEVKKVFRFNGDSYISDLGLTLKKNGAPIPDTRLAIGASVGDHAINHHTFYQIESEAITSIGEDIYRYQGNYSFTFDSNNTAKLPSPDYPAEPGKIDWAGVGDAYFTMIAIPAVPSEGVEHEAFKYTVKTEPFFDGIFSWILRSEKTSEVRHLVTSYVPVTTDGSVTRIYTGTKDYFLLTSLNNELSEKMNRPIDVENIINFSNYSFIRSITKPLSVPILYALEFFNGFTNNYGLAIIVFTFLFYSLLFPLRWSQSKSFKKAAANAPKMKEIQDKIKALQKKGVPMESPEMRKLQMEQLKMTKDALPIGGCLPMLLQFPLLIAFYTAVTVSVALRQAEFLWLPDLSAGDPYHILEFAFAISMILSMKFTPTSPTVTPEQKMQQKLMMYLMPVLMLWIMWQAPSGLLLYWFFGNIVSFGQQMVINKINKGPESPDGVIGTDVPINAKKVN